MKIIVSNSEIVFQINDGTIGVELCTINSETPDALVYNLQKKVWGTNSYAKWTKQDHIDIPSNATRVYGYTSYYKDSTLQIPGIIFMDNNNQIVGYSMSVDAGVNTKSLPFDENIPVNATKMIIQAVSDSSKLTVKFGV